MSDTRTATSIGARNAIERQTLLGMSRTRHGASNGLSSGQRPIQRLPKPRENGITKRTKSAALRSIWSGREQTDQSAMQLAQEGRPRSYALLQFGRIRARLSGFTPKQCASRKKPGYESTSTISCHCKARSFAGCTLNRICKYSMGPKMRASAILDGRTCHSRIEQAYAQPLLFEDAQRQVDMFVQPVQKMVQEALL